MSFPIFSRSGFTIGIGDSNQDGKLDFDFGLRHQSFGSSPWGYGSSGSEIGFNTQRGLYAGAGYSNGNAFGSYGAGGRIYADGGVSAGSYSNDVFGNYRNSHYNTSPYGYDAGSNGGNVYSGNYWGSHSAANGWGASNSSWAGNSWSGASIGSYNSRNIWGGGYSGTTFTPPFVPSYGYRHYNACGCNSVAAFMGF
jgi:hypothetical protein